MAKPTFPFTIGVEEEYMIVDPKTGELSSAVEFFLKDGKDKLGNQITTEMLQCQVEVGTPICTSIQDAHAHLKHARKTVHEIAQQHGIPASLHGTGGAWMVISEIEDLDRLQNVVQFSLDRKVCNTLNTVVITAGSLNNSLQSVIDGVSTASSKRNTHAILHVDRDVAVALTRCTVPQDFVVEEIDHSLLGKE
ncbi:MAG: hypothetical protein RL177_759, partial [Bacteroidota bacterium]